MSADTIVGEKVHNLMWRNRVSQTRLAKELGIAQPNVGKRLRGETNWTLDELLIVARFFDLPLEDLLPGSNYEPVTSPRGRKTPVGGGVAFLSTGEGFTGTNPLIKSQLLCLIELMAREARETLADLTPPLPIGREALAPVIDLESYRWLAELERSAS